MGAATGIVLTAGALLVWALGLYVVSRAPARRVSVIAAAAMACLSAYLGGEALGALAPTAAIWANWLRLTWWAPCLAAPTWLLLSLTLACDEDLPLPGTRPHWLYLSICCVALVVGAVYAMLGMLTLSVQGWSTPFVSPDDPSTRHAPPGPLLRSFQVFVMVCLVWSLANLVALWRSSPRGTPLRRRFGFLSASGVIFALGGLWIVVASGVYQQPGLPGQVLLIGGMAMMGWNLARYGALLAGEQVLGDLSAFAATMLAIAALYGGIVIILAPDYGWLERGLPLLLLVMATHVVVDTRGHLLDRVLYAPLVSTLRGQLRELANRVVRQPDELSALVDVRETVDQILRERTAEADRDRAAAGKLDHAAEDRRDAANVRGDLVLQPARAESSSMDASRPTELRMLVEGALRHLNDLPALSEHPLLVHLSLASDGASTSLERAAGLRAELDRAIERLRPAGARPSPGTSNIGGWLHYLVLKEAYADGRLNKQVMQRYAISEGTFHRARRRAIDAVAEDLWQRRAQRAAAISPSTSSGPMRSIV
jgi:N-terminal 7TM region of histidine kinase